MDISALQKAYDFVRAQLPQASPRISMILGSGWSEVAGAFSIKAALHYSEIPGLGTPGIAGHAGRLIWGELHGIQTLIFQGRRHWYEGEGWTPIALPVYLSKAMGAKAIVLSNAAGGIGSHLKPGDVMVIRDHINYSGLNPLVGRHEPFWGPRFPDMSCVYDSSLRKLIQQAGQSTGVETKEGVYCMVSGPSYETPAEIKFFKTICADAVGMSTCNEAILANASGLKVAAFSCISNFAAGISQHALSHEEVTDTLNATMPKLKALTQAIWGLLASDYRRLLE